MVSICSSSSDNIIIKSPNDKRLYRLIQLDNGLQALLIHDPNIYHQQPLLDDAEEEDDDDDDDDMDEDSEDDDDDDDDEGDEDSEEEDVIPKAKKGHGGGGKRTFKKAAAAMCVGMGSFSDPNEAQGLAHFLEHMLFMGSTLFPDENEYDSFLSKHGGSSNAYTETDHTCYHFEVKRDFLKGALERFSQFFISPLMKPDAMDREILAVDSEFNQVLQSDACRLQQLQCHTAAPAHPFNRFFWGNKKSLLDAMEKGLNLRQHILTLYDTFYHGGLMKLVVIGGEPLDVLQDWVLELFGPIKKDLQVKPEFKKDLPIWEAGKVYKIEAVKDVHTLELSWTLPSLRQDYLKKSEDYISHLIGHEGGGSLYYFLKSKGWVTSIAAGVGDEGLHRSSIAYVFVVSINLTDSGIDKIFEIIGYVYQYIKLLRQVSPQEWIFKELQNIGQMEFRFAEEQPQDDYAAELAAKLFVYPAEHVIYGEYAYEIWDPERIKYVLEFLRPENMRIDVQSKSCAKSKDILYEPWFGSQYTEEDVSISLMDSWKDPPEIDVSLNLPTKNEFIPCNFSIHADNNNLMNVSAPVCIRDEPSMKIWYKLDSTFKLPRANAYFRITLKGGYDSVKSCILTELFVLLLKDKLNDIVYQASVAKLETFVSIISDKLELRVYGFNDKLPVLLSKVLAITASFTPTEDRFKVIKEDMERNLKNANMKPLNQSSYLRLQILCQRFWDFDDKLSSLNLVSLADLISFIPHLLSQMYIDGLCHGNLLEEEATSISDIFKLKLCAQPLPIEMRHKEHVICLPSGANLVKDVTVKNKLETNSVIELYFQIEPESGNEVTRMKAFIDLFDEIVEEPLFNQLRTTEQLGYVVECSPRVTYRVHGLCFCVQSSKYNPVYLQGRVESFIGGLESLLEGLDKESFESYKSGLIAKLLEKDPSLMYETNRFWNQIIDQRYMFDMSMREVEEVRSIEKRDIIKWYKTYLLHPSPKCRKLAIRVWGCNTEAEAEASTAQQESSCMQSSIEDVAGFKASSQFYPSIC